MQTSEAELRGLMTAGLSGDATAYRVLLARLSRHLRAYFKGRLARAGRSQTEAEDLVQEALIAIHTRRDSYALNEPFTPWVHAIARYKLIDYLRQTQGSKANVPIEDAEELTAHDDRVGSESARDLHKLLARLPEKMSRSIQYVKLDGLTVAEAARRCGISESDVKISIHRGLKALAALIARERKL